MRRRFLAVLGLLFCCTLCTQGQSVPGYGSSVSKGSSYLSYDYVLLNGQPIYFDRTKNNITPPRPTHQPKPKYTKEAKRAKLEGTCSLWLTVGTDGLPYNVRVTQSVGMGLDEQAIAAIQKWKFEPARLNGQPVAVATMVKIEFKLH
ncbi:MAG TPA: energy transducer TonB [Terriglobales bacterium]|nr:energy transducer TonB [Terriglobales bacterium]